MLLISTEQAYAIDSATINNYKIPGIILMENAGAALAKAAFCGKDKRYIVVCGSGNNGGDGSVAARHLHSMGADVLLLLLCPADKLKGDALLAYEMALSFGVPVKEGTNDICFEQYDVIIDAILGIGAKGAPKGEALDAINMINSAEAYVVSADCPSGIDCDSGNVYDTAVKADLTVTFGYAKTGMLLYPARSFTGKLIIENIGFSPDAAKALDIKTQTVGSCSFPTIADDDFKGKRGKVLVAGGSEKYCGAALMASAAALKSGSGLVTLASPKALFYGEYPELIYASFSACEAADSYDAIVCGCGMGVTDSTKALVYKLVTSCTKTLVLDADGINCIAQNKEILKNKKCDIIITPHIGEMARFTELSSDEVMNDMAGIAKSVATEYNIIVVLKSASTVIAYPDGALYVNTHGTSGMATAGSGDVLAGIIGSFAAQGMSARDSAVNGVAAHSLAGELAADTKGKHCMSATDIINGLSLLELKGCEINNDA